MSDIAIKFENISKQYRLGNIGTGTLSHDLKRWWTVNIRGKEDPYLKIGQINDRAIKATGDYVWALKNINLEVKQGEVLGIIGKNGAGKSTLLKILSRVTTPTTGKISAKGRVASLLEVGTGFHPEMTGRENIYLNGSIMGMTKPEITRKFDEIVEFAGVEKYIETPVKRYSSGMIVRLGFAVAAYLEPEILVVDEVLAVGDAEFQKKAIGKMKDVSHDLGRTVLFVSHNMAAVQKLCNKGILLENGKIKQIGHMTSVVTTYLEMNNSSEVAYVDLTDYKDRKGTGLIMFEKIIISDDKGETCSKFSIGDNVTLTLHLKSNRKVKNFRIAVQLFEADGTAIANMIDCDSNFKLEEINGEEIVSITLKDIRFYPETYGVGIYLGSSNFSEIYDYIEKSISFEIINDGKLTARLLSRPAGLLFLTPTWELKSRVLKI
jgi:lipopolysaccharide transport system ATP-binding protein